MVAGTRTRDNIKAMYSYESVQAHRYMICCYCCLFVIHLNQGASEFFGASLLPSDAPPPTPKALVPAPPSIYPARKHWAPHPKMLRHLVFLSTEPAGSLLLPAHHCSPRSQLRVMSRPEPCQVHSVNSPQTCLICLFYAITVGGRSLGVGVLSDLAIELSQDGPPHRLAHSIRSPPLLLSRFALSSTASFPVSSQSPGTHRSLRYLPLSLSVLPGLYTPLCCA